MPAFSLLPLAPAVSDSDLLAIVHAGVTSRTTRADFLAGITDNILPAQTGQAGRYLSTNGTTASWQSIVLPSVPVTSVFGRVGDILAQTGDYSVGQVTGAAPLAAPTFGGPLTVSSGDVVLSSSGRLAWSTDLFQQRDGVGILSQRNGVNAQESRVYRTYTDSLNGEWAAIRWNGTTLEIGTYANGTGSLRDGHWVGANILFGTAYPAGCQLTVQTNVNLGYGMGGLKLADTASGVAVVLQPIAGNSLYLTDASGNATSLTLGAWHNPGDGNSSFVSSSVGWYISGGISNHLGVNTVPFTGTQASIQVDQATTLGGAVRGVTGQSANLFEWQDGSGNPLTTISENGYWTTRKTSAPPDLELANSEVALWLDATPGATKLQIKAKDSGGVVRTGSVSLA